MKYFYIGKAEALRHESLVYAVSPEEIKNYKELFGDNCVVYIGENLPHFVTVEEDDTVVEASKADLYRAGIYTLNEGEFILDGEVHCIYDYPINPELIKPQFDMFTLSWIESATKEEILDVYRQQIIAVSKELNAVKSAGFYDARLEAQLKTLQQKHLDLAQEIATVLNDTY